MAIRNELLTLGAIPPLTREEGERTRNFFGAMGKNGVVDTLLDLARSLNVPFRVIRSDGNEWLHVGPQQGNRLELDNMSDTLSIHLRKPKPLRCLRGSSDDKLSDEEVSDDDSVCGIPTPQVRTHRKIDDTMGSALFLGDREVLETGWACEK